MPELPEVETIKRDLQRTILGQTIVDVIFYDDRILNYPSPRLFIQNIKGKNFLEVSRRAKALIFTLSDASFLVIHLKMTGQLILDKVDLRAQKQLKETKVVFELSNGRFLHYNDQRLFGRLTLVKNLEEISFFKKLGPEPLNGIFSAQWLKENLKGRKAPIKTLLMNQNFLAGIGNIYASEILFRAGINPQRPAQKLTLGQIQSLHQTTQAVLKEAIRFRGTSMRNYRDASGERGKFMRRIKVYNRQGQPCLACGQPVRRLIQSGRSTFYCRSCQR